MNTSASAIDDGRNRQRQPCQKRQLKLHRQDVAFEQAKTKTCHVSISRCAASAAPRVLHGIGSNPRAGFTLWRAVVPNPAHPLIAEQSPARAFRIGLLSAVLLVDRKG